MAGADALAYESVRLKTQTLLIDFLRIELKLGHTFADSASIAKAEDHTDHYHSAKANAARAAASIRHFMAEVTDASAREDFARQLAALDRVLSSL